jgi:hypothetical protein
MSKGNSPAFPCVDKDKRMWTGMNLRDYFALEAMHGLLDSGTYSYDEAKEIAEEAYEIAEAMLDERERYR